MIKTSKGTQADIPGILELQEKNLFRNLTEEELKKGFVTTPFTVEQLNELMELNGVFVAKNENEKVIAYAFAGSWKYFEQWEIFNYMVSRFPQINFRGREITTENSFQYGPICIDENYRGRGIINLIFEEMRLELLKRYTISVTFINRDNVISKEAHTKKLGWEIIDEFEFNDKNYISLGFDMTESVL